MGRKYYGMSEEEILDNCKKLGIEANGKSLKDLAMEVINTEVPPPPPKPKKSSIKPKKASAADKVRLAAEIEAITSEDIEIEEVFLDTDSEDEEGIEDEENVTWDIEQVDKKEFQCAWCLYPSEEDEESAEFISDKTGIVQHILDEHDNALEELEVKNLSGKLKKWKLKKN